MRSNGEKPISVNVHKGLTNSAFFLGGLALALGASTLLFKDEGRGHKIAACAEGYEGIVQVTSATALDQLGQLALEHRIGDNEAGKPRKDLATLPGELACLQDVNGLAKITVLTQAGHVALLHTDGVLGNTLLEGLKWRVQLPPPSTATS